jgi:hypothetical protein
MKFRHNSAVPIGKLRITTTTTRVVETDMTVIREWFRLLADAPEGVTTFVTNVLNSLEKISQHGDTSC